MDGYSFITVKMIVMIPRYHQLTPFATDVRKMLPRGYIFTQEDGIRLNMVGLLATGIKYKYPEKPASFALVTAVEILTLDFGIRHPDPYELLIDAGLLTPDLKEKKNADRLRLDPYKE